MLVSLWKLWYNVLYLVIKWSKLMSPNGCMQFHPSISFHPSLVYMSFLKLIIWKTGNIKSGSLKMRQKAIITKLLYTVWQKFITKCVRYCKVWETVITNCVRYYKVWQAVITKCVSYCKVPQLLQSETSPVAASIHHIDCKRLGIYFKFDCYS